MSGIWIELSMCFVGARRDSWVEVLELSHGGSAPAGGWLRAETDRVFLSPGVLTIGTVVPAAESDRAKEERLIRQIHGRACRLVEMFSPEFASLTVESPMPTSRRDGRLTNAFLRTDHVESEAMEAFRTLGFVDRGRHGVYTFVSSDFWFGRRRFRRNVSSETYELFDEMVWEVIECSR